MDMSVSNREPETIEQLVNLMKKLMLDPTRVAIWFEILRKPGITAKELMNVIQIRKTAMYYHLNLLEENDVITAKTKSGQKHFEIILNFFELFESKKSLLKGHEQEFDLFAFMIINSFVQREINRIQNIPKDQYTKKKYPIPFIGMWFTNMEKLQKAKEDFQVFYDKVIELDEGEDASTITNTKMSYFWGLVDFESILNTQD